MQFTHAIYSILILTKHTMHFHLSKLGVWAKFLEYYSLLTKSTNKSTFYLPFYSTETKASSGKSKANKADIIHKTTTLRKLYFLLGAVSPIRKYGSYFFLNLSFPLFRIQRKIHSFSGSALTFPQARAHYGNLPPPEKRQKLPQSIRDFNRMCSSHFYFTYLSSSKSGFSVFFNCRRRLLYFSHYG